MNIGKLVKRDIKDGIHLIYDSNRPFLDGLTDRRLAWNMKNRLRSAFTFVLLPLDNSWKWI